MSGEVSLQVVPKRDGTDTIIIYVEEALSTDERKALAARVGEGFPGQLVVVLDSARQRIPRVPPRGTRDSWRSLPMRDSRGLPPLDPRR